MEATTRARLIDAAYEEIYSHGYQGAALGDILKKAGVHKGSMYHFFKNTKELALTAIEEKMRERLFDAYTSVLSSPPPYLPGWFTLLRDVTRRDFKRGCPIANLIQEMSNLDPDFNQTMKEIYANFRSSFKNVYDKAIASGELEPCDTDRLALLSIVVIEGAILSVKATGDETDYTEAIDMLAEYILQFRAQ
ncbi:MAG TPA: TetR/AcrR family transcriptional regulator [Sulfuricurvum sp.]|nr:TetR/AcrR family transcriptional regulator [Sulfuricurvum sp.]